MSEDEQAEETEEEEQNENPLDNAEYLREQYHGESKTQAEIAEDHGVTSSTVSHYMSKHGVETRGTQVIDERLEDAEWLEAAYHGDGLVEGGATMQEIADEVGCSDGTVMRRLRQHGVIEPPSEEGEEDEEDDEGAFEEPDEQ